MGTEVKTMKNKVLPVVLATLVLFSTTSCNSNSPTKASKRSGVPYSISNVTSYNADASDVFSEGYLFQQLFTADDYGDSDTYTWLLGCFNTKGQLQYCVEILDNAHFYAKNGCIQICEKSRWICVNQKGEIEYIYETTNSGTGIESQILCGGDSFILVSECTTGFENDNIYTYKIIDYHGNTIIEYEDHKITPVYKGEGLFYLDSLNACDNVYNNTENTMLFNANIKEFIEAPIKKDVACCYGEIYQNANFINGNLLSFSDGTLIDLNEYIDYDYIGSCESTYENFYALRYDASENGYLIYYKDDVPYLFNFNSKQSYDCFNTLAGHKFTFSYFGKYILALVNGDDNNTYFMIVDKDGQIIQELAMLQDSYDIYDMIDTIFYSDTIKFSYFNDSKLIVSEYNLKKKKIVTKDMTCKDRLILLSDYHDGWAKADYYDYSNNEIKKRYNQNYVNKKGDFLFDVDEHGDPVTYVKESQILKY